MSLRPLAALLLAAAPLGAQVAFAPPVLVQGSDSEPKGLAVADLDGNGAPDVVMTSSTGNVFTRFLSDGGGDLSDAEDIVVPFSGPWGVDAADLTGDAVPDVVVTQGGHESTGVAVMRGLGDGTFTLKQSLVAGKFPLGVVTGDWDADGLPDLAVANNVLHGCTTFRNLGASFAAGVHVPGLVNFMATEIAAADTDLDGDLDLALAHYGGVSLLANSGGAFALGGGAGSGVIVEAVAAGDLTQDGAPDLAYVETYTGNLRVAANDGAGAFAVLDTDSSGWSWTDVVLGDVDGDALPDALCTDNDFSASVAVFRNLGDGTLGPRLNFTTGGFPDGNQPMELCAGDWNLDGRLDLGAACRNLGDTPTLSVLRNIGTPSAWTHLGQGLAGAGGLPVLTGSGTLAPLAPLTLSLTRGLPGAPATLLVGLSALGAPFKGGTLVPAPDLVVAGLALDGAGALALAGSTPAGLPHGLSLWFQAWINDRSGPHGFSASTALQGTTP